MPEDKSDSPKASSSSSLSGPIAWASLFLLAAASGHMLDERRQEIWARAGAFGLAASVGLGSISKARQFREKRVRELAARIHLGRVEGRLTSLNERSASLQLIDNAAQQLIRHIAAKGRKNSTLLDRFPLAVFPIEENGEAFDLDSARSIMGVLRSVSPRVIEFEHDHAFSTCVVLLAFKLENDQKLCFAIDVMWTQTVGKRFASSGVVIAVGVPSEQVRKPMQVELG